MGYADYLKDMLRPMGVYNVDTGFGAQELSVEGELLDEIYSELENIEVQMLPPTATAEGLGELEKILPYHPSYITLDDRRRAVMALMRIDGRSFTRGALNDTLSGCGITARVEETGTPYTVRVYFPDNRGIPAGYDAIKKRIEAILPCHLDVDYFIIYISWTELEDWFANWGELDDKHLTWDGFERYTE